MLRGRRGGTHWFDWRGGGGDEALELGGLEELFEGVGGEEFGAAVGEIPIDFADVLFPELLAGNSTEA